MSQLSDQQLIDDTVELFSRFDSGFIGYPTASGMIPHWRSVAANASASKAERAIAGAVNKLHPYVVSNRDAKLDLDGAELLLVRDDKDLVEAVTRIKKMPGKDLGVPGGVCTAQTFSRLGLLDDYILLVHPILLEKGKRGFKQRTALKLVEAKEYSSGVVRMHYQIR